MVATEALYCFRFELLQVQPYWLVLYQWAKDKTLPHDVFGTFAVPAGLVMTSLMQTYGHKV